MREPLQLSGLYYEEIYHILKSVEEKTRESERLEDIWSSAMSAQAYREFSNFDKAYIAIYKSETREFRRLLFIGNFTDAQRQTYDDYAGHWRSIEHGRLFKRVLDLWEQDHTQSYVIPDFKNDLNTNPELTAYLGIECGIATALVVAKKVIGFALAGYALDLDDPEKRLDELNRILPVHEFLVNFAGLQIGLFGRYQEVQNELTEAQRMAAVGQFALGIVHDIRSACRPIEMGTSELRRLTQLVPKGRKPIGLIERSTNLLKGLADDLFDFVVTRNLAPNYSLVQARMLFEEALALTALPEDIQFDARSVPANLEIRVDREKMARVLLNLIKNAKEAIQTKAPEQRIENPLRLIRVSASRINNDILLSVEDSGRGIERRKLERIFNPFYSDKETNVRGGGTKGYGLGLATARMIVHAHGGRIEVESRLGEGSRFDIFLPCPG